MISRVFIGRPHSWRKRSLSTPPPPLGDQVPVYIVNFNRLETTRAIVKRLLSMPRAVPVILDNASTYPPLREWYATAPCKVIRLPRNLGHRSPWLSATLRPMPSLYVVTDSDLNIDNCPDDTIAVLWEGLRRYPGRIKSGLSLEYLDVPAEATFYDHAQAERGFWARPLDRQYFDAPVDTTFALYRSDRNVRSGVETGNSLRSNRPYTAKHTPWYLTKTSATEEDLYYIRHANLGVSNFARVARARGIS